MGHPLKSWIWQYLWVPPNSDYSMVLWLFFKLPTFFIRTWNLYFWSCMLWLLWKQSQAPVLWKTPLPYHIPSSFSLPLIPSHGHAALKLQILSTLHLVHDPSHKINSDILLFLEDHHLQNQYSQRIPFPSTAVTCCNPSISLNVRHPGGGGEWSRDRPLPEQRVCAWGLKETEYWDHFPPEFLHAVNKLEGNINISKRALLQGGNWKF